MPRKWRCAFISIIAMWALLGASAQTKPCSAGTLADVLGTSCSVGPLILNFQANFTGLHNVFEGGVETSAPITPAEIGFTPIIQDHHAGFRLSPNWVDGPGPDSSFLSGHLVNLTYTPQANPDFDIVGETLQMDATIEATTTNGASEQVTDFQDYPNVLSTSVNTALVNLFGTVASQLTDHILLPAPALSSDGFAGQPGATTTFLQSLTTAGGQGTLRSATFLYNVGPVGPLPPAALTYTNIDLPGAAGTFVAAINNAGRMAGAYQDAQSAFHGYVTQDGSEFTTIDFPNATATFGNGLNDRGDMVGSFTDAAGTTHGFILQDGNFTTLDVPNAIFTDPLAINDRRQIVGIYETSDQGIHGFLLDGGNFTSIDHNPDDFVPPLTEVLGINNNGNMVGTFLEAVTLVGLVQREDVFHTVIVPGQVEAIIESLNEQANQVGTYNDINLLQHGFITRGDVFQTVDFPNGNTTFPLGINASGQIVGQYADAAGNFHSFLAQPGGGGDSGLNLNLNSTSEQLGIMPMSQPVPQRICGSAEWRQHAEQIRNPASCRTTK